MVNRMRTVYIWYCIYGQSVILHILKQYQNRRWRLRHFEEYFFKYFEIFISLDWWCGPDYNQSQNNGRNGQLLNQMNHQEPSSSTYQGNANNPSIQTKIYMHWKLFLKCNFTYNELNSVYSNVFKFAPLGQLSCSILWKIWLNFIDYPFASEMRSLLTQSKI